MTSEAFPAALPTPVAAATPGRIVARRSIAGLFVVALLPLLSTPLLPFIDLYNHLARYFVLGHLAGSPVLRQYYAANWALLPNIGLDLLGTALLRVVAPDRAAHIVVIAIFAVQYGGVLAFNRALTGRWSALVALLTVPLLYSFILNWGFANFLFGLGLVFAAAAWWLAMRHRLAVAVPVAALLAVIIFFCHGLDFMLYGVLVASLEVGLFVQQRGQQRGPRRPVDLGRALVPVAVQAVIPALLFVLAPTSHSAAGMTNAGGSIARLAQAGGLPARLWGLFCYRLETIVRVAEGPSLRFDVIAFFIGAGLIAALLARGRLVVARTAWPALAAAAVLVVVMPPMLFGVGYVADRMPLFLTLLFVGALAARPFAAADRGLAAALAVLTAVRLAVIAVGWQGYAADAAAFRDLAARIPPSALVDDVMVGGAPRDSDAPRCAMYRPLLVTTRGAISPLFADEAKQPLRLVGRLRAALAKLPPGFAVGHNTAGYYDDVIAAAGPAGFDYLLVCNARDLLRPLPATAQVVARTDRLTLLKVRP